ncbi:MAG: hypothetical protein Q4F41_02155 [Eubacteriales bacterium]|nr:hypothetical protein [Eubacteriales bacterium]
MRKRTLAAFLTMALAAVPAFGVSAEEKITVTIPASMTYGVDFDEIVEEIEDEVGRGAVTWNADGSMTFQMTARAHREVLMELKDELDDGVEEIEERMASILHITYNYDLTEFEVEVDMGSMNGMEDTYAAVLEAYGNLYQAFDLVAEEEISTEVRFIDVNTGERFSFASGGGEVSETEAAVADSGVSETDAATASGESARIRQLEAENAALKQQIAKLEAELAAAKNGAVQSTAKDVYGVGDVWTVAGMWNFSIDSVTVTEERNEYAGDEPAMVVIVKYSYENLGYEGEIMDLYFTIDKVVDEAGEMGSYYPGTVSTYPQETPVGAKCVGAEECIGLRNESSVVTIYMEEYDSTGERQKATFEIPVTMP